MKLDNLENTSISIIINPIIGLGILKALYPPSPPSPAPETETEVGNTRQTRSQTQMQRAKGGGPRGIWFQPGAESRDIISYVKEMGLEDRVVWGGACILEDGDHVRKQKSKM